jgi:hypothetical protein
MQFLSQQKSVEKGTFSPVFGAVQYELHRIEQPAVESPARLTHVKRVPTHSHSLGPRAEDVLSGSNRNVNRAVSIRTRNGDAATWPAGQPHRNRTPFKQAN